MLIAVRARRCYTAHVPKLIVAGTPHELVEELVTIGRAPDNAIHIDDASVSGRHAELKVTADGCYVRDLGSTNGTFLNGAAITESMLRAGDRLRFGRAECIFEGDATSAAQPLPQSEGVEARPADFSARPVDFTNASPFKARAKDKDSTRLAVYAVALLAFAAFLASMFAVFTMRAQLP